jgi:His/Glu/Gln/Arg/opine family amino acid ABC transporter permease subunit|tara:strand:- start:12 stop:668 length:657 start_codon:yes stop_codon:yes gene_type:complete
MDSWDWSIIQRTWPLMRDATWVTINLFAWSLVLATGLGFVLALMRMSSISCLRWLSTLYVLIFRGLPALIILFFAYFWVGRNLSLSPFQSGVVGLSVAAGAYKAEIIRAGLLAVGRGQYEASEALGLSRAHQMRRIIIPQGVRVMIPNYMSNATLLLKSTSLASVIGITELTGLSRQLANSTYKPIEILTAAGLIYLALTTVLTVSQEILERRFSLKT